MRQELNNKMEQTSPPPVDHAAGTSWVDRRSALKSVGTLVAASALGSTFEAYGSSNPAPQGASHGVGTGSLRKGMISFMLPHEQFTVPELAGFDVLATSDHLQPWQTNERHAGEAWVTMGALGQRTQRAWMGTTVTCPTFRYHPAVVAEAFDPPRETVPEES